MRRRVLWMTGLVIVSLFSLPGTLGQEAPPSERYADVEFAVIITDPVDHPVGQLDIREVAIGEPGDETLVFRFKVNAWGTLTGGTPSVHVFFTASGTNHRIGINTNNGAKSTSTSLSVQFEDCALDQGAGYCTIAYEQLNLAVDGRITNTYAISYLTAAQDHAPGVAFADGFATNARGSDYTLTGCSRAGGCAPDVVEEVLEGPVVNLTLTSEEPTSQAWTYAWSTDLNASVEVAYNASLATGTLALTILDGQNETLVEAIVSDNTTERHVFEAVVPGNWTILVQGEDFTGSLSLSIAPVAIEAETVEPEPAQEANVTAENATAQDAPQDQDGMGIPGPGLLGLLFALGAGIGWTRRRRSRNPPTHRQDPHKR